MYISISICGLEIAITLSSSLYYVTVQKLMA